MVVLTLKLKPYTPYDRKDALQGIGNPNLCMMQLTPRHVAIQKWVMATDAKREGRGMFLFEVSLLP